VVALWSESDCFVFGKGENIGNEFSELLVNVEPNKFKFKFNVTLPRMFSLFVEGVVDYLVCDSQYVEYPQLAHELMQLIYLASQKSSENLSTRILTDNNKLTQIKSNPFLCNLFGKLLSVEKKLNDAAVSFREAIELNRQFGEPYGNIGTIFWSVGKQKEAFQLITESLLKNPYSISAQLNFFEAGYEMREYESMIRVIESIISNVTEFSEFRHHLAICYQKTGKSAEAVDILKGIINDFPGDEDAKKILSSIESGPAN